MEKTYFSHECFCNRLKLFMKEKNLSQEDLAKAAGISGQSVSNYMAGSFPKIPVLALWTKNLAMNAVWLLTGEGEMLQGKEPAAGGDAPAQNQLQTENARLRDDVAMLREHVKALNVTIETQRELIQVQRDNYRLLRESTEPYEKQTPAAKEPTGLEAFREEPPAYGTETLQETGANGYTVKKKE